MLNAVFSLAAEVLNANGNRGLFFSMWSNDKCFDLSSRVFLPPTGKSGVRVEYLD